MANIQNELNKIKNAVYGREVRGSIHDGIDKINSESEESKGKANEAHDVMESIINDGFDNAALEANFEQKLDDKIADLQPEWTQFKEDTETQLAQTTKVYRSKEGGGNSPTSVNTIQGFEGNDIRADIQSATISGGGSSGYENVIGGDTSTVGNQETPNKADLDGTYAHYSVIGGGYDNVNNALAGVLTGYHCKIEKEATHGTIAGGSYHEINIGDYSTISGGTQNKVNGGYAAVSGGSKNEANNQNTSIGGGTENIANGLFNTIGGGGKNQTNGNYATVGGGHENKLSDRYTTISGGQRNEISAQYGTVNGGLQNKVTGDYGTVSGGRDNEAAAPYTHVIGRSGRATVESQSVQSGGSFVSPGDSQSSQIPLRKQTTDATPAILGSGSTGNTSLTLPENSTWGFNCKIVARRINSNGESAMWEIKGLVHRIGDGFAEIIGTPSIEQLGITDGEAYSVDVVRSGYTLRFNVTGELDKTINWVGQLNLIQIIG